MRRVQVLDEESFRASEARLAAQPDQGLIDRLALAGERLAALASHLLDDDLADRQIVVLAGAGRNGAVGIAAAIRLHEAGAGVRIVLSLSPARLDEMAAHFYRAAEAAGLRAWGLSMSESQMADQPPIYWTRSDLIIDALIGRGLDGDPGGEVADLIRLANSTRRPILAFDRPSGLGRDDGAIHSPCIDATATLALGAPRRAHVEGWPVVGELWLARSGLDVEPDGLFDDTPLVRLGSPRTLES